MEPNPIKDNKRHHVFAAIVAGIVLIAGLIWYFNPTILQKVLSTEVSNSVIEAFQKGVNAPGALFAKVESNNAHLTVTGVLSGTNNERVLDGKKILTLDQGLNVIAKLRMNDMFAKGYFEHVSPNGQSASSVAKDTSYEYITIGENIALGNFEDDAVLVKAWIDSPGHKENILKVTYTHIGIAVGKGIYNGRSTWIAVQIFSKPLSACPAIDERLKTSIATQNSEIDILKKQARTLESEMETLKDEKKWDQYNQKVSEYNMLAKAINEKVIILKADIEVFNGGVRVFNECAI